jgi:hypothetical protein
MDKIKRLQEEINGLIQAQQFKRNPAELYDPIHYIMSLGGKRLRPVLTLLTNDLFGGELKNALYPALAIELFHQYAEAVKQYTRNGIPISPSFQATPCLRWPINMPYAPRNALSLQFLKCLAKQPLKFAKDNNLT